MEAKRLIYADLFPQLCEIEQLCVVAEDLHPTHFPNKVLSIFEEHTQIIRKGKAHKPTEFGRVVRIDEVENGVVSGYEIKDDNAADTQDWVPALTQHKETFGRAPEIATGDRGFYSAANERAASELGVKKVALPFRGKRSATRRKQEKQPWFRRALRWRAGIEGRIGTLKHRFDMERARYKGDTGFKRSVGWSVITNNLVSIARARVRRAADGPKPSRTSPPTTGASPGTRRTVAA
jgi:transposase, IS5 family